MARTCNVRIAIAAGLVAVPALAWAQSGSGIIAGTVRDATGGVLPGVAVAASSPALIEKVRTVVTDGEGQYKIIELRPGTYSVTFTLPGFSTVKREGIELTSGFTATVSADLRLGAVEETITVSGQTPVVDLQNTKQQVVLTREVIDTVPTGKSFQNLGVLIPGIVGGQVVGSTVTQDVGGQSGQNFMTMAIHGGRQQDQRIEIDGMSMSAWTRPDSSAVMFTDGNFQEYAIDVAAKSAESETGGVRINMIPREGGNSFKGSFFANFGAPALQSDNVDAALRAGGLSDPNRLKSLWSVNPTIGGPIAKDKLWFFGTFTYQVADQYVANSYLNTNPAAWDYVPDLSRQAVDDQFARDASARFTWQASARNKVTAYLSYNYACHCHFLMQGPTRSDGSIFLEIPNYLAQGTWTSPITNRLLIDIGGSYVLQDQQFKPRPESVAPRILDTGLNVSYRANQTNMGAYTPIYGGRGSVSYVPGSHAVKAGFNLIMGRYENNLRLLGNKMFTALNGVPTSVEYRGTPTLAVNRVRPNLGIFVQDQWTIDRLTVNAGLRLDYFRADYPDQNAPQTEFVPVPRSFPALEAVNWKDLNPRLGASFDLFGNGKTAVKASANRYIIGDGINRASAINPIQSNNNMIRQWNDLNNDRIVQGDPLNPQANGELGPSTNLNFGKPVTTFRYDPDWAKGWGVRPYNWEVSAGVQHELVKRVSVNVAYFRRIYGNFTVTDNLAVGPGDYESYCVTAPSDTRLPGGGNERICGLLDLKREKVGLVDRAGTAARNFGDQVEHWNGADFTVNARLPKVLLQGGVSTGKTLYDDCEVVASVPESVAGNDTWGRSGRVNSRRFCRVETPFLTQVKLLGSYTLPWNVQLAGTFQSIPGPEITASSTFTNAQVVPSLGRNLSSGSTATVALVEPGTLYGDRLNQVDLRVTKIFTAGQSRVQAMVDVYNVTNGNTVLVLSNTYGATTGALTGSAWLRPQAILPARIVKLGLQINF